MSRPTLVGITGGIGSGKTTVCRIFESLGVSVYYADDQAKQLMESREDLVERIKAIFGDDAYQSGKLNRKHIAEKAFSDKTLLEQLNQAVHPIVKSDFENWVNAHRNEKFLLKEAALLVETGSFKDLDKLIVVVSNDELRVARILKRDSHRKEEDVRKIIREQLTDEVKIEKADHIIRNDGASSLIKQVLSIYNTL
ncbi:MAG: dephospho-CoA kinase [Cyclobacteriaceae bacterium]